MCVLRFTGLARLLLGVLDNVLRMLNGSDICIEIGGSNPLNRHLGSVLVPHGKVGEERGVRNVERPTALLDVVAVLLGLGVARDTGKCLGDIAKLLLGSTSESRSTAQCFPAQSLQRLGSPP